MKKVLSLLVVIVVIIGVIYFNSYKTVRTFDIDGYLFTSDTITKNLINGYDETSERVKYSKVKYDDSLYKSRSSYFIGDRKKISVNIDYPVISSDSDTLLLLSDTGLLIDTSFRKSKTYSNSFISDSKLFNENDYERADNIDYLFVQLNNGIFVNLDEIKIIRASKEYIIPVDSFISFNEENIRYYYLSKGKYIYKEIKGLDKDSEIILSDRNMIYTDFLELLGLFISEDMVTEIDISPIVDEVKEEVVEKQKENVDEEVEVEEIKYIKPTVSFDNPNTGTYSFNGQLNINDPTGQIVKYPTFEFWNGKTMFVRKSFVNSGTIEVKGFFPDTEYEVIGTFNFKNEDGKEVKAEFTRFKITTKDMSNIENVSFNIDSISPSYNYADINGISLKNDAKDEVLKGIKKVYLYIGDNSYQLANSSVSNLLKLKKEDFSTAKSLASNTKYDVYFEVFDVAGNKLKVKSDSYSFKTTKQAPSGSLSVLAREISKATVKFDITNKDDINIANMYYILFDSNKDEIRRVKINSINSILIDELDANEVYSVVLYGDYDLEDGNGILKNQKILDGKFTTEPISILGYVKFNFSDIKSTVDSVSYSISLSEDINNKLRLLLSKFDIKLVDSSNNEVVDNIKLSDEQFEKLIAGESINIVSDNLISNHTYYFDLVSYVSLGKKVYDIKTTCNINNIKTLKMDADVQIINKFVTESIIDFDVRIDDMDGAIQSDRVLLEARDLNGVLIYYTELNINDDYYHVSLSKLNKEEVYSFSFIVEAYNIGHDNTTFKSGITLYEEKIKTEVGLFGSVEIDSLLKQIVSKNLFDLNNNSRWKSAGSMDVPRRKVNYDDNILSLAAKNGYRTYSYYLPEYKGKDITVSFKIKYLDDNNKPVYICNTGADNCATYSITGITKDNWLYYTKTFKITASNPYVSFTIREDAGKNNYTTILIKDFQIEAGTTASTYRKYEEKENYMGTFIVNLTDRNHEISKDMFYYYLRFYEDDKLVDTVQFDFNNNYVVIDDKFEHEIEQFKNYNIKLSVKKKITETGNEESHLDEEDGYRFYDIANLNFISDDEIRTIKTYEDLISVHTSGTYLVAEDIDYRNKTGSVGITFNGTIDFQGHKVYRDSSTDSGANTANRMFYSIGRSGHIKNIDLHYYFDGPGRSEFNGIAYYNYGTIENVMVTFEEGNNKPNTIVSFITRENYGRVKGFVINLKDTLSIEQNCGLIAMSNYGSIMNGYLYGNAINGAFYNGSLSNKYIGVVSRYNSTNAYLANIYSLVDIDLYEGAASTQYQYEVGNIIAPSARAILRNIYTYSGGKNRNLSHDINAYSGTINVSNMYYASSDDYTGTYSNRISPNALRNVSFQNIINGDNAFEIEEFVKYGYFPHLIWPDVMPNQEYIPLPSEDDGKVDYLNIEEKHEKDNESVEATLIFQNPGYDTITGLSFNNGLQCRIISQENDSNKSKVKVVFSSPTTYISKYSLTSLSYRNSAGFSNTIYYGEKDRIVEVDMYKNIYNMNDFKSITNNSAQNFKLQTDLDFNNISFNISTFKGKIDGNNHIMTNIKETNKNFINTLSGGTIKNLIVDGYTKDGNSAYGGFIGNASGSSTIDNVHLRNVNVTDSNTYVGGFVGYTDGALITNSSITNVHVYETNKNNVLFSGRYGGFIGQNNNSVIQNCYAQNVKLDITSALSTYGIGGFVGRNSSGYIQDSYVVGVIKTNQQEVGGIAGYNNAVIERVISKVDIYSQQDSIGGIVGYSTNASISNTLALGVVYSGKDAINLNRSIGNRTAGNQNFSWDNQLINGLTSAVASGDILVSTDELKSDITYGLFIGNQFDLSNLENEIGHNLLPKLKYLSSDELLPYQVDNEYYVSEFRVDEIVVSKSVNDATIQIYINNPDNYIINDLSIDGLKIINVNKNITSGGQTLYEVYVSPERYYDSYLIDNISYTNGDGEVVSFNPSSKIQLLFYKDIGSFEDWQNISSDVYENYRLVNDIDFSGKKNVKTRVLINKLEGTDGGHTIKNINISAKSGHVGLIDTVACNISNVNFENITIDSTSSTAYTGIIRFLNGTISNVNFDNITINSKGNYVGVISFNQAPDSRNVNLSNVVLSGASYIGAFAGYSRYFDVSFIHGNHITITGTNYLGGLIGAHENASYPTIFNMYVDDVNVTGGNYVGGIFGLGGCNYAKVNDAHIRGVRFVGGIAGQAYFTYLSYGTISNSEVTGTEQDIGGAYGYSYDVRYTYVDNVKVKATRANEPNNVGGISGRSSYTRYYCGVKNSTIENAGYYTGGITGKIENSGIQTSYVYNTTVKGVKYVGGIVGWSTTYGPVYYNISNADVEATEDYAGGIYGRFNNLNTTASSNRVYVYRNIVAGSHITTAGRFAGAISANTEKYPFDGHFYDNFVEAYINTSSGDISQFFIGNDTNNYENASLLRKIYVYNGSTYNGVTISSVENLPANITSYNANQLKNQTLFTGLLPNANSTQRFWHDKVTSGYYPYLNYQWNNSGIYYYELPTQVVGAANPNGLLGASMGSNSFNVLPEVKVYVSDVDKINVEFSKVDTDVLFKINNVEYQLNKLSYTFYYNFIDDFSIDIYNGSLSKSFDIKASDLKNSSSVDGNNYYFIDGKKVLSNNSSTASGMSNKNVDYKVILLVNEKKEESIPVNLYGSKVLLSDQNIYDYNTKSTIENSFENLTLVDETVPLYSFSYGDNEIDTYYNYSIVNGEVISKQLFVRDNNIEVIDSTLDNVKNSILVNQYNGSNYLIYLGNDGKLYSLKDNIVLPEKFRNNNIKSISTDMYGDSNIVFVLYNNNDYIVFDYLSGKVISKSYKNSNDLESYFKSNFGSNLIVNKKYKNYNQSIDLIKKLNEKDINSVLGRDIPEKYISSKTYTTVYNPVTESYEVYEMPNINNEGTNGKTLNTVLTNESTSNTINNNQVLFNYYIGTEKRNRNVVISVLSIIISIFVGIIISVVLLKKNLKKSI